MSRSGADPRPLIVHVVFRFDVGGLENGIVNLINRLPVDEFRHAIVALTECDPGFSQRIERDDVKFISLHKPPGHGWRLFGRMYRLCRELRPAIVHSRNLAALEMQLPAWAARVPVRIHGEHGRDVTDPDGTNPRHRAARRGYRRFVDHFIAVSKDLEAYLREQVGVAAKDVSCICNGVDAERFHPRRPFTQAVSNPVNAGGLIKSRGLTVPDPVIDPVIDPVMVGAVGRLQKIKGHAILIDAVHRLLDEEAERRGSFRVQIVGDGPLRKALEERIVERGVGDVIEFAGERSDIPAVMRGFDVFVLPSLAEGISNTILEAMASGLPVVATEVGGNAELVTHAETGLLVPPSDPAAMAEALALYLDAPELRLQHGANARAEVEAKFTLSGMVHRYEKLYHDTLARQGWRVVPPSRQEQ